MLKKKNSIYHNGRPKGMWYKWKRDPKSVDAVLMYAQRGHGKEVHIILIILLVYWMEKI